MSNGLTIVIGGNAAEEPSVAHGPPGATHFKVNPPQPLRLEPPKDMAKAPIEGQAGRFVVEGRFIRSSKEELVFQVEHIYDTDFDVEAAFNEIASEGDPL